MLNDGSVIVVVRSGARLQCVIVAEVGDVVAASPPAHQRLIGLSAGIHQGPHPFVVQAIRLD